jgi:hypothetical protein
MTQDIPARLRLVEIVSAAWISQAVSVLAELGIADVLDGGPRTTAELAETVHAQPDALDRFLHAAATAGVLEQLDDQRFALTEVGKVLRANVPSGMREMCRLTGMEEFARTWSRSGHTARTGRASFDEAYGRGLFDYMADPGNASFAGTFHRAMAESAAGHTVRDHYDWSQVHHVVDVGGGRGAMIAALLTANPHLRGTVFDLPAAVDGAEALLAAAGVADRAAVIAGSFFDTVPGEGDVYLLSRVIGNWPDDDSVRILAAIRSAMKPSSRLVIVGHMPGPDDRTHYIRALDLYMFVLLGARLRSPDQYRNLFARAGFELTRFVNQPDTESLIEARPV